MSAYDIPALWCVLQAAVLSLLGLVAVRAFARRAPAAAATAAVAAAVTIGMVTVLIPIRMPTIEIWLPIYSGDLTPSANSASIDQAGSSSAGGGGVGVDVGELASRLLKSVGAEGLASQEFRLTIELVIAGLMTTGAAVGLVRLVSALWFVRQLRRSGSPIRNCVAVAVFEGVRRRLEVGRTVDLCESPTISSPAVIGVIRPLVLLPVAREGWTESQLAAALAHELAHVKRRDYLWRMAASVARAMHYFHPLVHLLTRRLALVQELATDRLAASAVGGTTSYVHALSTLALRLDDQTRLRAEPLALPALSTNLMRRISMLRSKEGSTIWAPRGAGLATAAAIALVGAASMALRGSAESGSQTTEATIAADGLFARPAIETPFVPIENCGLIVVRASELTSHTQFVPAVGVLNGYFRGAWPDAFGVPAPEFNFDSVEYIAGIPQLTIKNFKSEANPEHSGTMMLGCGGVVIRFNHNVDWREWMKAYIPDAVEKSDDAVIYLEMPVIPALGPTPLCVAARDSQTIVCTGGVDLLKKLMKEPPAGAATWGPGWDAIDGGLISVSVGSENIDPDLSTPKAPRAEDLFRHVKHYGIGFDLDAAAKVAGLKLDLQCADAAGTMEVQTALAELMPQAVATIEAQVAAPSQLQMSDEERARMKQTAGNSETDRRVAEFWLGVAKSAKVDVILNDDGAASVRISATAPFPDHIVTAYEVAEKPDADAPQRK
jgi:beta-lactamase regulating signal transducer with metallopeptidase domain